MSDYLVFQLYAPLVSWGTQAVGQERPGEDHPSRSALLGLLAAALGIDRQDEANHAALSEACRFGIKQLAPGLTLRDFHTTQVPPATKKTNHRHTRRDELREDKLGTILSFRSYRQDALSIVALQVTGGPWSLKDLQQALQQPRYHLYFGRKSCAPALPLHPQLIEAKHLKAALDAYPVDEQTLDLAARGKPRYHWEEMENTGLTHDYHAPRYDQPLSRKRWQFGSRREYTWLGGSDVSE